MRGKVSGAVLGAAPPAGNDAAGGKVPVAASGSGGNSSFSVAAPSRGPSDAPRRCTACSDEVAVDRRADAKRRAPACRRRRSARRRRAGRRLRRRRNDAEQLETAEPLASGAAAAAGPASRPNRRRQVAACERAVADRHRVSPARAANAPASRSTQNTTLAATAAQITKARAREAMRPLSSTAFARNLPANADRCQHRRAAGAASR